MQLFRDTLKNLIDRLNRVQLTDLEEIDYRDNFLVWMMNDLLTEIKNPGDGFDLDKFRRDYSVYVSRAIN